MAVSRVRAFALAYELVEETVKEDGYMKWSGNIGPTYLQAKEMPSYSQEAIVTYFVEKYGEDVKIGTEE